MLNLGSFTLLPQHVVRLILARDELQADEFTKFQAALMWSKKYCDANPVSLLFLCSLCFSLKKDHISINIEFENNLKSTSICFYLFSPTLCLFICK